MDRVEMLDISTEFGVFAVELTRKQVKNINLRVKSTGTISVSASPRVSQGKIVEFVVSNDQFIADALEKLQKREAAKLPPLTYSDGEIIRILGQYYTLEVRQSKTSHMEIQGEKLVISALNPHLAKRTVEAYLRQLCAQLFLEISQEIHKLFAPYHIPMPQIHLRHMTSQWGSCMPQKAIVTLNTRLIEKPKICIAYVILHEFCHFIHPNHSPTFHNLVGQFMPDWKTYKKMLEALFYATPRL